MVETFVNILVCVYVILGYWATGQTIYANKIVIHRFGELFIERIAFGAILGWILIPIAVIKAIMVNR